MFNSKEVQNTTKVETEETIYTSDKTETATKQKEEPVIKIEPLTHIVQTGERLWGIAKKYGITLKDIAEANNIADTSLIKIDQKSIIPEKK